MIIKKMGGDQVATTTSNNTTIFFTSFILIILLVAIFYFLINGNFNTSLSSSSEDASKTPIPSSSTSVDGCSTCSVVPFTKTVSATNGTKRALLFGCNYNFPGSLCISEGCVLNGCIDDVNNIRNFLLSIGYLSQNILMYTDLNTYGTDNFPTRNLMLTKIQTLVSETQAGDSSYIWYSGHGSQIANSNAEGGYNECWCPPDTLDNGNYIRDYELHQAISGLVTGAKLFIGSDSCHSGTVFDLQYYFAEPNATNFRSLANKSTKTIIPPLKGSSVTNRNIIPLVLGSKDTSSNNLNLVLDSSYYAINGLVITISGSQNQDVSSDAFENGSAQGAMTWSFLTNVQTILNQNGTLQDLIRNMRLTLSSNGFTQIPQLESSLDIDPQTNLKFIFSS